MEADLQKAIALSPGNVLAERRYGYFLASQGRFPAASAAVERALAKDPLDAVSWFYLGYLRAGDGQYPAAHQALQRALEISPTYKRALRSLAVVEILEGRPQDAAATCRQLTVDWHREACEAMTEHALGHAAASQQALQRLVKTESADGAFAAAGAFAMQGDADQAFQSLDRAYTGHSEQLATVKSEATLVSLHRDPRYKALLRKMNLPE